jgi:hypothetical protein
MAIDHGKCTLAATAIEALLDGLGCNEDERLTVLANLAAWTWQEVATENREGALVRWLALVKHDAELTGRSAH